MQRDSVEQLELLPKDVPVEYSVEVGTTDTDRVRVRVSDGQRYLKIFCVFFIVACTCANFALWCQSPSVTVPVKYSTLEQPSTYIGLDKIQYDTIEEKGRFFRSFPILAAQVSRANRRKIWGDGSKQRSTTVGTVSADVRHFFVTPDISTIIQFKTTDFGYETCELHFTLPASLGDSSRNMTIWSLDTTIRLDPASLSWNTRPPRYKYVGVTTLLPNTTVVIGSPWRCVWGTLQTFEFASLEGDDIGVVDFWQDPRSADAGPILMQRSSLV